MLAARNRKVANQIPEGLLRREIEAEVVSEYSKALYNDTEVVFDGGFYDTRTQLISSACQKVEFSKRGQEYLNSEDDVSVYLVIQQNPSKFGKE